MGRSKKHHRYTDEQLTQLAALTTRKELKRFARITKHSYQSVYVYWRRTTGKKLTDFDPTAKGAPRKPVKRPAAVKNTVVNTAPSYVITDNSLSVAIKSLQIVNAEDGTQRLVITY